MCFYAVIPSVALILLLIDTYIFNLFVSSLLIFTILLNVVIQFFLFEYMNLAQARL